jgi:putative hydrolase of the HAD superfamily
MNLKSNPLKALIFDWGDTIMRDFPEKPGPMYLWDQVEWIPGAEQALKELHDKFVMVIATNAGQSDTLAMIKALRRVGADKYFRYFFSSKDLKYEKPDVRFFQSIASQISVLPERCAMIGNLYEKDIVGAKQCGMFTVLFDEKQSIGNCTDADKVIFRMEQLPKVVCF